MRDAPTSGVMRAGHPLRWYFALAFAISWTGSLLVATQDRVVVVFVAMLLGPSLAGVGLTAIYDGAHGLRRLWRGMRRVRAGRLYLALLIAPSLLALVLLGMSRVSPAYVPAVLAGAPLRDALVYAAIAGLGAGFFEELGWTGFATPRLLAHRSWLRAGLWLGVPWAIWHVLPDYVSRSSHGALWVVHMAEWIVALTGYRMLMTWVYRRARSVSLAMLMHAAFTGSQALLWPFAASAAQEVVWYGLFAVAIWAAVLVVAHVASVAPTRSEVERGMRGDALVPNPMLTITHAITISAPPGVIWPWLAQMGAERAGWYSYDRIDNGGVHSAYAVREELQWLEPGDVLPAIPGARDSFIVATVDPPRDLILTVPGQFGPIVSWEHTIEPLDAHHSRLIVRGRVSREWKRLARSAGPAAGRPSFIERVFRVLGRLPDRWMLALGGLGHRWMEIHHLRGIKRRAEAG